MRKFKTNGKVSQVEMLQGDMVAGAVSLMIGTREADIFEVMLNSLIQSITSCFYCQNCLSTVKTGNIS